MAHSERFWFERWLKDWASADLEMIREARDDHGYQNHLWDIAWAAWQERSRSIRRQDKPDAR